MYSSLQEINSDRDTVIACGLYLDRVANWALIAEDQMKNSHLYSPKTVEGWELPRFVLDRPTFLNPIQTELTQSFFWPNKNAKAKVSFSNQSGKEISYLVVATPMPLSGSRYHEYGFFEEGGSPYIWCAVEPGWRCNFVTNYIPLQQSPDVWDQVRKGLEAFRELPPHDPGKSAEKLISKYDAVSVAHRVQLMLDPMRYLQHYFPDSAVRTIEYTAPYNRLNTLLELETMLQALAGMVGERVRLGETNYTVGQLGSMVTSRNPEGLYLFEGTGRRKAYTIVPAVLSLRTADDIRQASVLLRCRLPENKELNPWIDDVTVSSVMNAINQQKSRG